MVDSKVKGLQVISNETGKKYTVYALIPGVDLRQTYFLIYNDELRKENKGFKAIEVTHCRPVEDSVGLLE